MSLPQGSDTLGPRSIMEWIKWIRDTEKRPPHELSTEERALLAQMKAAFRTPPTREEWIKVQTDMVRYIKSHRKG